MTDHELTMLIDRYLAIWSEPDAVRRQDLIEQTWTADGTYLDPLMAGDGHAGLAAMVAAFQTQFPGARFRRLGAIDAHHDRVRFGWELRPGSGDGPAIAGGVDFGTLAGDRLRGITGFLDVAPSPAPAPPNG